MSARKTCSFVRLRVAYEETVVGGGVRSKYTYRCFDDVTNVRAGSGKHCLDVLADLLGLFGDVGANEVSVLVNWDLTGEVECAAGFHSMGLYTRKESKAETVSMKVASKQAKLPTDGQSNAGAWELADYVGLISFIYIHMDQELDIITRC